jgi:hypothetical protein
MSTRIGVSMTPSGTAALCGVQLLEFQQNISSIKYYTPELNIQA